jgi:hypothetical protein
MRVTQQRKFHSFSPYHYHCAEQMTLTTASDVFEILRAGNMILSSLRAN